MSHAITRPADGGGSAPSRANTVVAVLAFGGIVVSLMQTLVIRLVPELPKLLDASASDTAWAVTATLLAAAVATPVMGRLGDMYGKRKMLLVTLARQAGVELPPPGLWMIDPVHSSVEAVAQHLGLSSVRGCFTDFAGHIEIAQDPDKSRVEAVIRAASIDTGNDMRDDHLCSPDFLDADRHLDITYTSTGLTPAAPDRWTVHGDLTLAGVVRPVDLDLTYLGTGPDPWGGVRAAFRATTELRCEDFAMNYNQVVRSGIAAVGAILKVELDIQAVQGGEALGEVSGDQLP